MDAVRILERPTSLTWDYDEDADVLYLSVGEPRPAVGIDVGDGLVLRFDETRREVAGLTVIGLRERLLRGLQRSEEHPSGPYYGLFQFLRSTFKDTPYGDEDIYDPRANARAAAWMWKEKMRDHWVCQ